MYNKDIDHLMIFHLKDVCKMCRISSNPFPGIVVVPCGAVEDVSVNFIRALNGRDKCRVTVLVEKCQGS